MLAHGVLETLCLFVVCLYVCVSVLFTIGIHLIKSHID